MYLFLDAEYGGLEKENYSLLTIYLMMTDDSFNVIGDLSLFLKPDNGIYQVCASAMNVNKIDLVKHDTIAIPYKEGATKLYNWLKTMTDDGKTKTIVVGHGIHGDIEWIVEHLITLGSWEKFTSYRKLDTSVVCQFLKACNLFPIDVSGSLTSLAKYFNVEVDENKTHSADYDVKLTFKVFIALRKLLMGMENCK